jgi:succinate dehydrogenase/fumarate reductase cytochrome b subunit
MENPNQTPAGSENEPVAIPDQLQRDHRRQKVLQIYLPLGIGVLVFLAIGVLAILSSSSNYNNSLDWANISLIMLIIMAVIFFLIVLIILAAMIYGVARLTQVLPIYTRLSQYYVYRAATIIFTATNSLVKPVVSSRVWLSSLQTVQSSLSRLTGKGQED